MNRLTFVLIFLFFISCSQDQTPLQKVLNSDKPLIKKVMKNAAKHEVQIMYSQIDRDSMGKPYFIDHSFKVNDNQYFYPASTVKMPVAFLALEKLKEMQQNNINVDRNTPYSFEGDTIKHTISKDIIEIFAVSDNSAYNRLYEFLGRDYINYKMNEKGLVPSQFSHRLSVANAAEAETKPILFFMGDSLVHRQESIKNAEIIALNVENTLKGKGYKEDGKMVTNPMDFSKKNQYSITAMHNTMKQLVVPGRFQEKQRFDISKIDREFLIVAMSTLPKDVKFKNYDPKTYYDSYVKFFMFGDKKDPIPNNISIYNKVGYAYGYLTDCAYITDYENKIAFILTATVHVNENGIFNDDTYEYDEVGIPFLAELGRQVYDYELNRKKNENTEL
ncbi:serine hydrolase [Spongiivirga sp. MCCC 1A20706]|uniref:serine hydrolase n=1 Tax=Spongiivirga sp. MCCC 1A20706 TaxID=3160963 RepID=UPI003977B640